MKKIRSIFLLFFCVLSQAFAGDGKLEMIFGTFSMSATGATGQAATVSGLGAYSFKYKHQLLSQIDIGIGYSIIATDTFGGDLAYGLDVGVNYFPFSRSSVYVGQTDKLTVSIAEKWRPYIGVTITQRQFQTISANISGLGFVIGSEYSWKKRFSFKGEIGYASLSGARESTLTETLMGLGIVYHL